MHSLYPSICVDNKAICDVCQFAKHKKLPFITSLSHFSSKFELLHCDIWGLLGVLYIHGHKYYITIVDDYSRFVSIILIKSKAEVSLHIQQFITLIEISFTSHLKHLKVIMALNFIYLHFTLLRVFYTRDLVLKLLNKMPELRGNINIF